MENLCLLLGGRDVEGAGLGRLYAGVLFHASLGRAAYVLPALPCVPSPLRRALGGLKGNLYYPVPRAGGGRGVAPGGKLMEPG